MDLPKGDWQVPLDPDARLKSAFTPLGLFEFLVLPFDLEGASATSQGRVDRLLRGWENLALASIDDICVFSQIWEEHVSQVKRVLGCPKEAELMVKAGKCKVETIRDWSVPQTKKQGQAFTGMVGYDQRFVPHLSSPAAPITELCKKGKPDKVVWTELCQGALCALKEALIQGPVNLVNPDSAKPFSVFTDASDAGLVRC
ncbi:unnamed protein product [Natator depressus]